jgi:hypothetical protein
VLGSKRVIEKTLQQVQLDNSSLNSNVTVLQHTIDRKNLELKSAGEELARAEARRLAETTALETKVKTLKTDAEHAAASDAQSRAAMETVSKAKRASSSTGSGTHSCPRAEHVDNLLVAAQAGLIESQKSLASMTHQQDDNKHEQQALRHAIELLEVDKKAGSEALAVWQRKAEEAEVVRASTQQELGKAQELSAQLQNEVGSSAHSDAF